MGLGSEKCQAELGVHFCKYWILWGYLLGSDSKREKMEAAFINKASENSLAFWVAGQRVRFPCTQAFAYQYNLARTTLLYKEKP